MSINGTSSSTSSPMSAVIAGVRAQHKAAMTAQVLDSAGLLDDGLAAGLEAHEAEGRRLTDAGLTVAKHDLLGTLLDALG